MSPIPSSFTDPVWGKAGRIALACIGLSGLVQCSGPASEVVVSVKDQRLGTYSEGHLTQQYVISTSKFGVGDRPGTYCTPLGKHEIIAKIGHGLPAGAVLKSRHWNGEVLKPNAPGRDPIVSRILWLRGLESSNRNAFKRYIYIHGTTEEERLGTPASYGCIRMGMKDVIQLFDDLPIGAKVVITKDSLPEGKEDKQTPAAEAPSEGDAPAQAPSETVVGTASDAEGEKKESVKSNPASDKPSESPTPIPKSRQKKSRTEEPPGIADSKEQPNEATKSSSSKSSFWKRFSGAKKDDTHS